MNKKESEAKDSYSKISPRDRISIDMQERVIALESKVAKLESK